MPSIKKYACPPGHAYFFAFCVKYSRKGVSTVKEEEKKPTGWEVTDPKPPVIHSGHLENRKANDIPAL